jgi:hypothetical protein
VAEKTLSRESILGFATPPPPNWRLYNTLQTIVERKKGVEYIKQRARNSPFTPTTIRVIEKVKNTTSRMLLAG